MKYDFKFLGNNYTKDEYIAVGFEHESQKYPDVIRAYRSPLANCQTFSIANGRYLSCFTDDALKAILKELVEKIGKHQMLLDLKYDEADDVIEALEPYIAKKIETKYISTNGSNMILYIIQLDRGKLGVKL